MTKVLITTAVALSPKQLTAMTKELAKKLADTELVIEESVDSALIGGMRLTVGSQAYDATIQARLEQLKKTLIDHVF